MGLQMVAKSLQMVTVAMKLKDACSLGKKALTNLDSVLKSRNITLPSKFCIVKAMFFQLSRTGVNVGLERRLSTKEWILSNCGVREDS